tara:strand:- start:6608 stop:7159 length:552 start_codon:yes stop_codon:yes gene_type:complete
MKEWIGYYENVLPETLSKNIMDIKDDWKPSGFSSHEGRLEDKSSKERVVMDEIYITQYTPYYNDLFQATLKVVKAYKLLHPYTKYMSSVRCTNFRVNKYQEGGFMSEHADAIHHSHGQQYGFPEVSVLFFLNTNYGGGELVISNNIYKPKKNSAIIFPANFMFPHYVKPITKGTRYSIITWLM